MTRFFFLHAPSNESWETPDPIRWCLACEPVLDRAKVRLLTLTNADKERIIRLVTRRCQLHLIEIQTDRIVVHFWGKPGLADLRPFFKRHDLARKKISVFLCDRKRETVSVKCGSEFLYGEKLAHGWPIEMFLAKWQRRDIDEPDDWTVAPGTWSGYAWDGIESNRIPWSALKSAWRRAAPFACLNCDAPTIITNFGFPWGGLTNRYPRFSHVCPFCRGQFDDRSIRNVGTWMVDNLDPDVWPDFDMIWDTRVKWKA